MGGRSKVYTTCMNCNYCLLYEIFYVLLINGNLCINPQCSLENSFSFPKFASVFCIFRYFPRNFSTKSGKSFPPSNSPSSVRTPSLLLVDFRQFVESAVEHEKATHVFVFRDDPYIYSLGIWIISIFTYPLCSKYLVRLGV